VRSFQDQTDQKRCARDPDVIGLSTIWSRVGEPIYYHGSHELFITAGGPQTQL